MPTVQPDQGVGGLDAMTKLSDLFAQQNDRQQEIYQAHLNALTAIQQRITMGGYGATNYSANDALAGVVTSATLQAQRERDQRASGQGTVTGTAGGPPLGQTTLDDLARQGGQGSARSPQAGGQPAVGGVPAGVITQAMLNGGAPYYGYSGAGPGSGGYGAPMMLAGQTVALPGGGMGGSGGGIGGGGGPFGTGWGYGGGGPGSGGYGSGGMGGFAPAVPTAPSSGMVGMASRLPVIGSSIAHVAAIAGAATGEWRDQKNKNLWYKAYGGDQGAWNQFGDRVHEEFARFSHPFTFSGQEASQLYKQATAMGLTSTAVDQPYDRSGFISMAADAKNRTGMNVDEFSSQFDSMRRAGNPQGMETLITSIQELEKTAARAGVNVRQATIGLENYTQQATAQFGSAGGLGIGSTLSNMQASWGAAGQDFNVMAPLGNTGYQYMQAGMLGMSMPQMQAQLYGGSAAGVGAVLGAQAKVSKEQVDQFLKGSDPQGFQTLMGMIQQQQSDLNGPNGAAVARQIAAAWMETAPHVQYPVLIGYINKWTGQSYTDVTTALTYYIINGYASTGMYQQGKAAIAQQQANSSSVNASGVVTSGTNKGQNVSSLPGMDVSSIYKGALGVTLDPGNSAGKQYVANYNTLGASAEKIMGNRMTAGLYRDIQAMGQAGKSANPLITVTTKSGPVTMRLTDALQQGFAPEILAGQAVMAEGEKKGDRVGQIGGFVDTSTQAKQAAAQAAQREGLAYMVDPNAAATAALLSKRVGTTVAAQREQAMNDQYDANYAYNEVKQGHRISIILTPEAKKLLRALEGNGTVYDAVGKPRPDKASSQRDGAGLAPNDPNLVTRVY